MALGSFEVTPLDIARAYLPFVNGGRRTPPAHAVRAVQERGGAVDTGDDEAEGKPVISPAEANLMTSLLDRKSTRLNSSHEWISYAVFCLKKKKKQTTND